MTHPNLLTLEHEDLGYLSVAFLHSDCQEGVIGTAVQHGICMLDADKRNRLQFCLQNQRQRKSERREREKVRDRESETEYMNMRQQKNNATAHPKVSIW